MNTNHMAAATIQQQQNRMPPKISSASISNTIPESGKGPVINGPARMQLMKTTQDFGLSFGKNGYFGVV